MFGKKHIYITYIYCYNITDYMVMKPHDFDDSVTMTSVSPRVLASASNGPWRVSFSHHSSQISFHIDRNKMAFRPYESSRALSNDHSSRMISYISDIEMVFVPCECEYVVSIHHSLKNVDHNHRQDTRTASHEQESYSADLDTFSVSPGPTLGEGHSADKLGKESHGPWRCLDYIQPIEHQLRFDSNLLAVVVVVVAAAEVEHPFHSLEKVPA